MGAVLVTGSGIGPLLGQILAEPRPVAPGVVHHDARRTYGDALVDEVEAAQPDAVISNRQNPRKAGPS